MPGLLVSAGSRGSWPKERIWPATWAPMSMTSSGSIVPVALIVAKRSPRSTVTVRKPGPPVSRLRQYQPPNPAAITIRINTIRSLFIKSSFSMMGTRPCSRMNATSRGTCAGGSDRDRFTFEKFSQVGFEPTQDPMQLLLLQVTQPSENHVHLVAMNGQDAVDQMAALGSQHDLLGAQVGGRFILDHQAGPLQSIDNAGHAGWANKEPFAEIGQAEPRKALLVGTVQVDQHAPLSAADAKTGEIGLHDSLKQPDGPQECPERFF